MICKTRSAHAIYYADYTRRRIAAGLCLDCKDAPLPGRRRCAKCLEKRKKYKHPSGPHSKPQKLCTECRLDKPLVPGGICGKCCELLANDALRSKAHSRCEEGGTLEVALESAERSAYREVRADKLSGQGLLPFVRQVGIPKAESYKFPEYSRTVFSESLKWNR